MARVYRIEDDLRALKVRLRLRLRQDGLRYRVFDDDDDDDPDDDDPDGGEVTRRRPLRCIQDQVFEYNVRWQEKVASPVDVFRRRDSEAFEKVLEDLETKRHYAYTYVATDSFRTWDKRRVRGEKPVVKNAFGGPAPVVQNAAAALQVSASTLWSLDEMTKYRARTVNERLNWEDPANSVARGTTAKTMERFYLVLAVDPNIDAMRRSFQKGGNEADFQKAFHESVACAMVARGGQLEVAPGFADVDPYFADMRDFVRDVEEKLKEKGEPPCPRGDGLPLNSTRLATPKGDVWEFVVENVAEPDNYDWYVDEWERDVMKHAAMKQRIKDLMDPAARPMDPDDANLEARQRGRGAAFANNNVMMKNNNASSYRMIATLNMEIVKAFGFDVDWLYVEYEAYVPKRSKWVPLETGADWGRTSDGDFCCAGCTQLSRVRKQTGLASDNRDPWRDEANVVLSFGVVALCFSLVAGLNYVLAFLFGVLILAIQSSSLSSPTDLDEEDVAAFNCPVELAFARLDGDDGDDGEKKTKKDDDKDEDLALMLEKPAEQPRIYFQITSKRSFERYVIEGYAHARLPLLEVESGGLVAPNRPVVLTTWRPIHSLRDKLQDFFIGGAHRLGDMRYAAYPPDLWHATFSHPTCDVARGKLASKLGFLSQTGEGCVELRYNARLQRRQTKAERRQEILADAVADPARIEATARKYGLTLSERTLRDLRRQMKKPPPPRQWSTTTTEVHGGDGDAMDGVISRLKARLQFGTKVTASEFEDPRSTKSSQQRAEELIRQLEEERRQVSQYRMGKTIDQLGKVTISPTGPKLKRATTLATTTTTTSEEGDSASPRRRVISSFPSEPKGGVIDDEGRVGWAEAKKVPPPAEAPSEEDSLLP